MIISAGLTATDSAAWMGLNDIDKEGSFVFVDGKPFVLSMLHTQFQQKCYSTIADSAESYQNWDTGEPNGPNPGTTATDQDCGRVMNTGKWRDTVLIYAILYICIIY